MDNLSEQLGAKIRARRESLGYTQEQVAQQLKISQNAYSKVEIGYTRLTVERLFWIAEVLNTAPELLISLPKVILVTSGDKDLK